MPNAGISGLEKLRQRFEAMSLRGQKEVEIEVGFHAPYAVAVHEDIEEKWRGLAKPRYGEGHTGVYWGTPWGQKGQSKFLEKAYRRLRRQTLATIVRLLKAKRGLKEACMHAGIDILNLALTMVPVDTGALYESGYVRVKEK